MSIEMDRTTYQSAHRLRDDTFDQDRSFRVHYRDYRTRPSRSNHYHSRRENYSREYSYESPSVPSTTYRSPSYYNSSSALPYHESDRDDYTAIPTNYRRESSSRSIEESSYGYRDDEYRSSPSTCSLTFLSMRSEPYGSNSSSSTSDRYPRNDSNHRSDISLQRNHHGSDYHDSRSAYSSPSSSSTGLRRDHSYRSSRDYHQIEPSRYSPDYHFYPSIKRSRSRYDIDDELRPAKRR